MAVSQEGAHTRSDGVILSAAKGPGAWRAALIVALAAGAVRLLIGALTPLFPDETYYWEFSRRLAAGYFDHPPVIAWLVRFGTEIFGDTALGVRFGAVIAGGVAAFFTAASAKRLRGPRG